MWEEPVISGTRGSGTVFFSGCTLGCVFCQNHEISAQGVGKPVTVERLGEIFRELICQGAHNINLVTPGHFAPWVARALEPALPVPWPAIICSTTLKRALLYGSTPGLPIPPAATRLPRASWQ